MTLPAYVEEALNKKASAPPTDIDSIIAEASATHDVEPELIKAMIDVESGNNPLAVSEDGAQGLMQLMDGTAKEMGVKDITNPYENIMGGTKYLKKQIIRHKGNIPLALASYNAGPGAVQKYGGIPPFKETQKYVPKVLNKYNKYKQANTEAPVPEAPVPEAPVPEAPVPEAPVPEAPDGLPGVDSPVVGPKSSQTGGLPSYVKEAMEKEKSAKQSKDPRSEPQEWDPEWMKEHPNLAGLYGAGRGILEQAIAPSIEATGAVIGSMFGPVAGTALGFGIARQLNDVLIEAYNRLGGEPSTDTTIAEEMKQSAADVGTALILGKTMEMGAKAAPYVENYLFDTLPKRLYGSAIKTPMSKKWIQTLPNEIVSKQTAVIQEGLDSRITTNEFGLTKIKNLQNEALEYIDDITKILSEDPSKVINREALLEKGLEKAHIKASNSSDPVAAKNAVDAIAARFRSHPKNLTPTKANQIKRQLYEEVKYGGAEPSAIKAQIGSSGKKGIAREIMLNLEEIYPAIKELNATDAARIGLVEAIEKAYAKEATKNMVPLGAKILLRPKAWPLAIWEGTMGHPRVKTQLAFALHKANPAKYPAKPPKYVPPVEPKPVKPTKPFRYEPPSKPLVKGTKPAISLPRVKSPGAVTGPLIEGKYTPDQLSKMLRSKNATQQEMAIDDIITTRKNVEASENERRRTVNKMLKSFKDSGKKNLTKPVKSNAFSKDIIKGTKTGEIFDSPIGPIKYDAAIQWETGGPMMHQYTPTEGAYKGATFTIGGPREPAKFEKAAQNIIDLAKKHGGYNK